MFVEFVIQNQYFSFPLEDFAQILRIPCEGTCVFSDRWSLDELVYGAPSEGPYQNNLSSSDDIISYIREDQEGQVTRIRHQEEIDVQEYQSENLEGIVARQEVIIPLPPPPSINHLHLISTMMMMMEIMKGPRVQVFLPPFVIPQISFRCYICQNGGVTQQEQKPRKDRDTRRGRHSTFSSSAFDQPSSSYLNDYDDDGNGKGTLHVSTPSPIRYVNSLTNEVPQVFQNLPNIDPHLEPFYTHQTKIINRHVQIRDEHHRGLRLKHQGYIKEEPLKHWKKNGKLCKLDIINPNITIEDQPLKHVTPTMEYSFIKHVDSLFKIGSIRPSKSRHRTTAMIINSGITIDPVTGKEIKEKERMVFNYKSLNDNTYKDQYSLSGISTIIKRVGGAKIFSKFNLKLGFHQVAIDEESIPWTAFLVPGGLYEWLVMPFSLKNDPAVFRSKNQIQNGITYSQQSVQKSSVSMKSKHSQPPQNTGEVTNLHLMQSWGHLSIHQHNKTYKNPINQTISLVIPKEREIYLMEDMGILQRIGEASKETLEVAFMLEKEINEGDSEDENKDYQYSHHAFMFHPGPPKKIAYMVQFAGSWKPSKELPTKSKECEHDWKETTVTNYTICYYCGILTTDMSRLNCPKCQLTTCAICARNYLGKTANVKGKQPHKLKEEKDFSNYEEIKGTKWMVFNYKSLNDNTYKDQYSLLGINTIIKRVGGAKIFSKFDLKSGFHQVFMDEKLIPWTTFLVPGGLYEWLVMPSGLKNAMAIFQRKINKCFKGIDSFIAMYIDDVMVFSKNEKEHAKNLEKMLKIREDNGLVLSPSKMKIAAPTIDFLGAEIKGTKWMVFNYKSLNDNTYKDQYSLLGINTIIKRVGGAKIFSKFDLKSGFHQVFMDEKLIPWTTFLVPGGLYEWLVMPSGLKNAMAIFQRKINKCFKGIDSFIAMYIDDVMVFSKNEKEHAKNLEKMLKIREDNGLVILLRPLYEKTNAHGDKRLKPSNYELVRKIKTQVQNLLDLEIPPEDAYIILETDGCMERWGGIVKWKNSKEAPRSSEKIYAYPSGKFSMT
uniref:Putative polyprotein n=1 Tax=Tanacetum cinerariifolium TaxID=118510 RepID=A0A6L2L9E3_TANCI|nr:putative polyprotein [Tanacetum cinerariifolium]